MKRFIIASSFASFVLASAAVASAQDDDPLAAAEAAYQAVDFERTLEVAGQALEAGGHSTAELARIYELVGIAAAALGDEDRSRDAYTHMLALRPDTQVDMSLAPRLRSPFLEARGYWAAQRSGFGAEVTLNEHRGELLLRLNDPLHMAAAVVMYSRVLGSTEAFHQERRDAAPRLTFGIAGYESGAQVEYYARAVDAHGNDVVELGAEDDPVILGEPPAPRAPREEPVASGGLDGGAIAAIVTTVIVVVGAALAVGGYFLFADQGRPLRAIATFE